MDKENSFWNKLILCVKEHKMLCRLKQLLIDIKRFVFPGPLLIQLLPAGILCNHKCRMCDNYTVEGKLLGLEKKVLPIDTYLSLINSLPLSVRCVEVVGGGEPLLYKDIGLLFERIKNKKLKGSLITNGSLLSPEIAKRLVDCKWDSVRISLDAASRDTFRNVHQVDYFDLVVKNIRDLLQLRKERRLPYVGLHFVIQKDNYFEICDFINLANTLHVNFVSFDTLVITEVSRDLLLSPLECKKTISFLETAEKKAKIIHNIEATIKLLKPYLYSPQQLSRQDYLRDKWCSAVQGTLQFRSNGLAVPCCFALEIARNEHNIQNSSIKKIWRLYRSFRNDLKHGKFYAFCIERCNYDLPM